MGVSMVFVDGALPQKNQLGLRKEAVKQEVHHPNELGQFQIAMVNHHLYGGFYHG